MPLREIESAPVRQHMFGNPFKINKNMIMDEVVMDEVSLVPNGSATGASASNQPAKGVKRPATPDSPGGPMASKRLRKGKQFHRNLLKRLPIGKKTREIHFLINQFLKIFSRPYSQRICFQRQQFCTIVTNSCQRA